MITNKDKRTIGEGLQILSKSDKFYGTEFNDRYFVEEYGIDINNITKKIEILKPKLKENILQLSDRNKINFGFELQESVIDVEQCGYGISMADDILFTYGIEPCCGLVLYDENIRVLFHLDGSITPEAVMEITNGIGLKLDATAFFVPGASCGMPGSFEYKKLEDEYRKIGYKILEQRIPATLGFVTVGENTITIGSGIDRTLDKKFLIEHKSLNIEEHKDYSNGEFEEGYRDYLVKELMEEFDQSKAKEAEIAKKEKAIEGLKTLEQKYEKGISKGEGKSF